MIIHTDFVTNSSSSFYIIFLDKEAADLTTLTTLVFGIPLSDSDLEWVVDSLRNSNKLNKEEMIEKISDRLHWDIHTIIEDKEDISRSPYIKDLYELTTDISNAIAEAIAEGITKKCFLTEEYYDSGSSLEEKMDSGRILDLNNPNVIRCSHH